jgi:hypothetical protein
MKDRELRKIYETEMAKKIMVSTRQSHHVFNIPREHMMELLRVAIEQKSIEWDMAAYNAALTLRKFLESN